MYGFVQHGHARAFLLLVAKEEINDGEGDRLVLDSVPPDELASELQPS